MLYLFITYIILYILIYTKDYDYFLYIHLFKTKKKKMTQHLRNNQIIIIVLNITKYSLII